jgi:hypothetical protein
MTIEWHISEDENVSLPTLAEEKPPRPPSRWLWVLLVIGIILLGGAGFLAGRVWRAKTNEGLLRAEITEVVRAETQAQAFGLFAEANRFAVPTAPIGWRMAYAKLFYGNTETPEAWRSAYPTSSSWRPPTPAPEIQIVSLDQTGNSALVELQWHGRSTTTEQRAYQFIEGVWRRVPWLEPSEVPSLSVASQHYRIQASVEEMERIEGGEKLLVPLETLYQRMDATWEPDYLTQGQILTVTIEPRELYTLLIRNRPDEIILNSLDVGLADSELPFSAEKQRLVLLCSLAATYRINRLPLRATMGYPPDDGMAYNVTYHLLPQAESYHMILNDAEALALRNLWRESLQGDWFSPFVSPKRPEFLHRENHEQVYQNWLLSSRLLIEYIYLHHGVTPGMMIKQVSDDPQRPLIEHVAALTGIPLSEVESRVQSFALTPE